MQPSSVRIAIICIFFLIALSSVAALGIVANPGRVINYPPDTTASYEFCIRGSEQDVEVFATGAFSEHVTLDREIIRADDRNKCFTADIKLPEPIGNPGHHLLWIGAREIASETAGVGTRIDIRTFVRINVLHPGTFLEARFEKPTVENRTVTFTLNVNNFGLEDINEAGATLHIYDLDSNRRDTLSTTTARIASNEEAALKAILDATDYTVGDYRVTAIVTGDGRETELYNVFRIGALQIAILDFTKTLTADHINRMGITVESRWDEDIHTMFAELLIADKQFRSEAFDLATFETKNVTIFVDTAGIAPGQYDAEMIVHYLDQKTIAVDTIDIVSEEEGTVQEKPSPRSVPLIVFMVLVLITLIVVLDILLLRPLKRRDEQ